MTPPYTTPLVDYRIIADAQRYYAERGFEEVPVPWIVHRPAYYATKPPEAPDFFSLGGYLNASGEQGFIELLMSGAALGRNQCVTACFREEPVLDALHLRYFMKLELIDTSATVRSLDAMIVLAKTFIGRYRDVRIIRTDERRHSYDIVDRETGTELGSYGIRTHDDLAWTYGTGVALPRLQTTGS